MDDTCTDAREVFFHGVEMDPDVLRTRGVEPGPARRAHVDSFVLRIGQRARLAPRGNLQRCWRASAHYVESIAGTADTG